MSRIALIPSAYPPTLGGVQELTRHLALALTRAGDVVEVWTQQEDGLGPSVETLDGLTVRRFPFPLPRAHPGAALPFLRGSAAALLALRRASSQFRPDVLHVQCFGPNGAYATALSRLMGLPLVITLQGETVMDDSDIFDTSSSLRTALRLGLRRAAVVSACSQFTLDDAHARFGLPPGRGEVIFNGVLVDGQERAGPGRPEKPSGRYVLALGRIVEKKGFDLLIRGFAVIAAKHPDVHLAIGGAGPVEWELHQLVDEVHLWGRVRFLGRLSRDDVAAAMDHAEIFVLPSRLEPFGIVVLEAWRAGRAVIATSRGGPPEFVDDAVTGMLVDPFDTAALARILDLLLSDADLRRSLGAAGRKRVDDFAWPQIAAEYRHRYRTLLGPPGAPVPVPTGPGAEGTGGHRAR